MRVRIVAAAALVSGLAAGAAPAEPPFANSVASSDIDLIAASDPAVPGCLRYLGRATEGMAGALDADEVVAAGVHTFEAAFADGALVGLWVHPSVGTKEDAQAVAALLAGPMGRLTEYLPVGPGPSGAEAIRDA